MADTGWQYPGTVTGVWGGGNDWTAPNNVKLNDGSNATWAGSKFDGDQQDDGPALTTTNYGFSIPAGYVIQGIETRIEGWTDGNVVSELAYFTVTSTEKRNDWTTLTTNPGNTHVYGSSTDRWGAVLTPDAVNATSFGWKYMIYDDVAPLNMAVDYMQMKIYYEPPPPIVISIGT